MKIQKKRKVWLLDKRPLKPIEVVQYDTAIQCVFEIQDFEFESGTTATIYIQKPSGKFVYQEDNILVSGDYEGVDYIPDSNGIVTGMTSLSPNMTILTDTEGIIVECKYNKDTNKVITKICDALGIEI